MLLVLTPTIKRIFLSSQKKRKYPPPSPLNLSVEDLYLLSERSMVKVMTTEEKDNMYIVHCTQLLVFLIHTFPFFPIVKQR